MRARGNAIGHAGNIDNDRFDGFVQRIVHCGQRDRAGGVARRDDDRSPGIGVIIRRLSRA